MSRRSSPHGGLSLLARSGHSPPRTPREEKPPGKSLPRFGTSAGSVQDALNHRLDGLEGMLSDLATRHFDLLAAFCKMSVETQGRLSQVERSGGEHSGLPQPTAPAPRDSGGGHGRRAVSADRGVQLQIERRLDHVEKRLDNCIDGIAKDLKTAHVEIQGCLSAYEVQQASIQRINYTEKLLSESIAKQAKSLQKLEHCTSQCEVHSDSICKLSVAHASMKEALDHVERGLQDNAQQRAEQQRKIRHCEMLSDVVEWQRTEVKGLQAKCERVEGRLSSCERDGCSMEGHALGIEDLQARLAHMHDRVSTCEVVSNRVEERVQKDLESLSERLSQSDARKAPRSSGQDDAVHSPSAVSANERAGCGQLPSDLVGSQAEARPVNATRPRRVITEERSAIIDSSRGFPGCNLSPRFNL